MKSVRMFLTLTVALLGLGSGAWLPASPHAVVASPPQAGLTAAEWQIIQSQVAKLTAADGTTEDIFGYSVAVSGDTTLVGAVQADVGGQADQGAAYVFYRNQGGADAWGQVAKLTAADGMEGNNFGISVSVDGDTAIVGPGAADPGSPNPRGAAYVFYRNQGGADAWGQVAKLTAVDGTPWDFFGDSVSVGGDTAVVGAWSGDVGGNEDQGAAYVFYRNQGGPDAWGQVARLTAGDGSPYSCFGYSVSLSGDMALAGAFLAPGAGAAYVFYRDQGGPDAWGQVAKLTADDGAGGDSFGYSVSISGQTALVGAYQADVHGHEDQGAAYVFSKDQGGPNAWGQVAKLTANDGAGGDLFGYSASVCGETALVGAVSADFGGNADQGAAYVYSRDSGGPEAWGQTAKLTAEDGAESDELGFSAATGGATVLTGALLADVGGHADQGAAYVFSLETSASLHVADVQGRFSHDPYGRTVLRVKVTVHDQNHDPVGGVAVDASIWSPVGGPYARTRMTKDTGMASFPWGSKLPGSWQLCVDYLTKAGYTYDPASNDVPNCAGWDD
jgi:hypothetical protein